MRDRFVVIAGVAEMVAFWGRTVLGFGVGDVLGLFFYIFIWASRIFDRKAVTAT